MRPRFVEIGSVLFSVALSTSPVLPAANSEAGHQSLNNHPPAQRPTFQSAQGQEAQKPLAVSMRQIVGNAERFYGNRVIVKARVAEVYGKTVFSVGQDGLFSDPEVLVIAPGGINVPAQDTPLTVTGIVREFTAQDIQRDFNWFGDGWHGYDWSDYKHVWERWQHRPVIIADFVQAPGGREFVMWQKQGKPSAGTNFWKRQLVYITSPEAIAKNPQDYYSYYVSVRSSVAQVHGPHLFTLKESNSGAAPDVLVFVPQPEAQVPTGAVVTVIGSVRPFNVAEFERHFMAFDLGMAGNPKLMEQWESEGRPAIIAHSVRTQTGDDLVQRPDPELPAVGAPGGD